MRAAVLLFLLTGVAVADAAPNVKRDAATRRPADAAALSAADRRAIVDAHNALRAEVGCGPMTWDARLEEVARRHLATLAASCTLTHGDSPYGENLAAWTGDAPAANAVALWGAEKPQYTGGGGPYQGVGDGAGHYTQVVWRATTKVGCARVRCARQGKQWTLVSCNYDPRGNVLTQIVY